MSHKISPILRCEHPKTIYKDGKRMMVACGKCHTCQLRKANTKSTILRLFGQDYKYCHFITLTYAPEYLPTYRVTSQYIDGEKYLVLVNNCTRSKHFNELLSTDFSGDDVHEVLGKIELGNNISYCSKEDLQKFMKRFRINLKRHTKYDEKEIKYFAVSEYGPKHLRAHYHLLFWHNEPWNTVNVSEIVRKSWSFGRVDVQLSRGHAAEYCVSYLNSNACLPRLYQVCALRPWSLHSIGLLKNTTTKALCEKVYVDGYRGDLEYTFEKDGRSETALYPLQIAAAILPRLPYHGKLSRCLQCSLYRLVHRVSTEKDGRSYYQISRAIAEYYYARYIRHDVEAIPQYDSILSLLAEMPSWENNILRWNTAEVNPYMEGLEPQVSLWMFIYGIFRLSNIAMNICEECHISIEKLVNTIAEFYDAKEMRQLSDYYLTIQDLSIDKQACYFSDTLFLLDNKFVKEYLERLSVESAVKVRQRIKHKVINDLHNLLT